MPDLATDWGGKLEQAIAQRSFESVYQPIIDLSRRIVVGYEALTRFSSIGDVYVPPDQWFAHARALGLSAELDAAALSNALEGRDSLPRNCFLSVNLEPESLLAASVQRVLAEHGNLAGLIIEITEHERWDWPELQPIVDRMRRSGAMFAVDDAGAGHAGLQQVLELRPSILKLDRALVEGIDDDEAKRALVEMLGLFANRLDAWILAEGVETGDEARVLANLEVPLAQGYFFGRPGAPWQGLDPGAVRDMIDFIDVDLTTLHQFLDPVTAISQRQPSATVFGAGAARWTPVVDDDNRPVGLLSPEAALSNELVSGLVVNVTSTPQEVAGRLSTAPGDCVVPVLVTDAGGRYLGMLTIRRLLHALSGGH